jgi:membrane protease YdiL (CAAX protease family)
MDGHFKSNQECDAISKHSGKESPDPALVLTSCSDYCAGIVNKPKAHVWKKIAVFYALTLLMSCVFYGLILYAGRLAAGNLLYVTALMWCPALGALATKAIYRENVRDLGWHWGPVRYSLLGYLIPVAYALPVYVVVWLVGLGGFYDAAFVQRVAGEFGWPKLPPGLVLCLYTLIVGTVGMIPAVSRALGEEIGWRGFLVPELAKVAGFPGVALISGIMWAAWHYPLLIFGDYNSGTPAWYGLSCFTAMVVATSFIAAWLRLRSGSLWTAALLHASHNLFIQSIFTRVTAEADTGITKYIIDEFGAGLVITTAIGAVIVCRIMTKQEALELPE